MTGKHGSCPWCGGKDRFRFDNRDGSGSFICNGCGAGDGFAFVGRLIGSDVFPEILEAVAGALGIDPTKQSGQQETYRATPRFNTGAFDKLLAVAQGLVSLNHPTAGPARNYFENRGLVAIMDDLPDPAVIGFHPSLPYWHEGRLVGFFPVLVARIQALSGGTVTLHRTFLTADGCKADVPGSVKKIMSPVLGGATQGAAIRLFRPTGSTLHIAEGIEKCFAVRLAMKLAAWSSITAGGMAAMRLPDQIRNVKIWADLDRSGVGQRAAESLAKRLAGEGRTVHVLTPPGQIPDGAKSLDWLDIWNHERGVS
ncbi:MAG: toprim domain-containing protein [Magnetococcus sp. DMHC-8]